jgi:hypothetical protein
MAPSKPSKRGQFRKAITPTTSSPRSPSPHGTIVLKPSTPIRRRSERGRQSESALTDVTHIPLGRRGGPPPQDTTRRPLPSAGEQTSGPSFMQNYDIDPHTIAEETHRILEQSRSKFLLESLSRSHLRGYWPFEVKARRGTGIPALLCEEPTRGSE